MSRLPRGLSEEERAAWSRLAATVEPLPGRKPPSAPAKPAQPLQSSLPHKQAKPTVPHPMAPARHVQPTAPAATPRPIGSGGLDSHWERRLRGAKAEPDFTLDLHGCSLDAAHQRLDRGLMQARAMGARVVLVVTGKPRPVDAADRGEKRGAIRAKIIDWLAAGPHGNSIAAIRNAHRRHGGEGALYLVLKRDR